MKLRIDIDDDLLQKAKAATGIMSDAELIEKALQILLMTNYKPALKSDVKPVISKKERLANQAKILELAGKVEFFEGYPN